MIHLQAVEMTPDTMQSLEELGLIYRLHPGARVMDAGQDETTFGSIYECDDSYGGHKLITVTVNAEFFRAFGSHPENEEFLFIGDPNTKPLYLLISYLTHDMLSLKIKQRAVCAEDFILLKAKYNDPSVSFFTMIKGVPHGECTVPGDGKPASFYVTESKRLHTDLVDISGIVTY